MTDIILPKKISIRETCPREGWQKYKMFIPTETKIALIKLMTPLLLPAAKSFGINDAHFGAIMLVNLCFGNLTPPFAATCFVSSSMAGATFTGTIKEALPFLIVGLIAIAFTTFCPDIVMWLPNILNA